MPPSKLNQPARKLFACHLADIKYYDPDGWYWQIPGTQNNITIVMVWVQGIVVEVDMAMDHVMIDDGTGVVEVIAEDVRRIKKLPRDQMLVQKGSYVMVVGSLQLSEGCNHQVIKAVKITCLDTETAPHETHWMLEVLHYHKQLRISEQGTIR
ncbi:recQ-mediated genome instability protein 2-like [Amphiura filiformis]|uniref:recQ-mediated genome instability protein 2-like n=1 Tax=Amphiura filiformis TaxID=82378 RepID=UPI003B21656A